MNSPVLLGFLNVTIKSPGTKLGQCSQTLVRAWLCHLLL